MGGGCTHVAAEPLVPELCEGTRWAGGAGVDDSWPRDVLAHPKKDSKAAPAEIRMRTCLFTIQRKDYHCLRLLGQRWRLNRDA
jgi:hypothetical protein